MARVRGVGAGIAAVGFEVGFFEVGGGELESVEGDAGGLGIEEAVEDAADDLLDDYLDGVGVFEGGDEEGVLWGGGAEVVVEVAVLAAAEGGGLAAEAVGFEMAAAGGGVGLDEAQGVGLFEVSAAIGFRRDGHRYPPGWM